MDAQFTPTINSTLINDTFNSSGDNLISSIIETDLMEPINPSLIWPQLIQHPKFIGSKIKIKSTALDGTDLTYEAIVAEISESEQKQMVLILKNIHDDNGKLAIETLAISYADILSVTLIDTDPVLDISKDQSEHNMDISAASSEISFHFTNSISSPLLDEHQNVKTPENNLPVRIPAQIPFLDDGKIDLFYLEQIYKLESECFSGTFAEWKQANQIDIIMTTCNYTFGLPLYYSKLPFAHPDTLATKLKWESSFSEHKLSFDLWYVFTGQQFIQSNQETPIQTETAPLSNSFSWDTQPSQKSKTESQFLRPSEIPSVISDLIDTQLNPKTHSSKYLQKLYNADSSDHYYTTANIQTWVDSFLKFEKEDFMLNGKYAWLYLPTYLYIPDLFLDELKLYPLNETQTHILWMKLNNVISQANDETENTCPEGFLISSSYPSSPWHIFTSKAYDGINNPNIIDHVQHYSAWKFYMENKQNMYFSKKHIYDLFVRPIERLFSTDSILSHKIIDAVFNMISRNYLHTKTMEITGLTPYKDEHFDAHYLLFKLSKIRHLSHFDLSNKKIVKTGPLALIAPYPVYEPHDFDIPFEPDEITLITNFLSSQYLDPENHLFKTKQNFPLSIPFLDSLKQFGGRDINLTNQSKIQELFNDLFPKPPHNDSPTSLYDSFQNLDSSPPNPILSNNQPSYNQTFDESFFILSQANLQLHDQRNEIAALARALSCTNEHAHQFQADPPDFDAEAHAHHARTHKTLQETALALQTDIRNLKPTSSQSAFELSFNNTSSSNTSFIPQTQTQTSAMATYKNQASSSMSQGNQPQEGPHYSQALQSQPRVPQPAARPSQLPLESSHQQQDSFPPLSQQRLPHQRNTQLFLTKTSTPLSSTASAASAAPSYPDPYPNDRLPQYQRNQIKPNLAPTRPEVFYYDEEGRKVSATQIRQSTPRPDERNQSFQQRQQQFQQRQRQPFLNGSRPNLLSPTQLLSTIIVPRGRLHKNFNQGAIARRIFDRQISQRLGYTINHEELSKQIQLPPIIEGFGTLFWTTTALADQPPRWAQIPHSSKTLANVIDQPFTTKADHPHRYYDGIDLAIFPMDDNSYTRDITFNSHKRGADWFLKIREDRKLKESPWEETYIYVHWNQVVYLYGLLQIITDTPLPPATEMFKTRSGTFASKSFQDAERHVQYFVDVIQEPRLKGSLRMVHITQETLEPDQTILGVISFPWHEMELFVQKLHLFKANI